MELFTAENIGILIGFASTLVGMYAGFKARMSVLEKAVADLERLVEELRKDIKALLSNSNNNSN